MEITYTNHEGFYLPNLTLPRKEEASFGRYGRLRFKYLKEHRRVLYINLLTSGELAQHLNEADQQAREMLELLTKQIAQEQGITEQLKAEDLMAWVGAMNNIRSAAEEVVIREVVLEQWNQVGRELRSRPTCPFKKTIALACNLDRLLAYYIAAAIHHFDCKCALPTISWIAVIKPTSSAIAISP